MKAAGWRPPQEGNLQPEEPGAQGEGPLSSGSKRCRARLWSHSLASLGPRAPAFLAAALSMLRALEGLPYPPNTGEAAGLIQPISQMRLRLSGENLAPGQL